MKANNKEIEFHSSIAPLIKQFIQEKRVCGYKYDRPHIILKRLDNFLSKNLNQIELPERLVLEWLVKQPHEAASTHQIRIVTVRQLAKMMVRMGYPAFVVPDRFGSQRSYRFLAYIFTHSEIKKIIHAADLIKPNPQSSLRHLIMPEIFRLLYCCGFRLNEVLTLRVGDVDLKRGVITVRNAKHGKDRLIPPSFDLVERLQIYADKLEKESLEKRTDKSFFFPSNYQKGWSTSGIYAIFRKILYQCGIPHAGRGKGPRVHDIRHTFAVHRLIKWHEEGADLNAKMPLLIAYLGHQDFTGTQKYLHLTAELFPNLTTRMNKEFGDVIPMRR